ncbi:MAG: nucleoside-triphosphatase [Bacillota bacterium]|nr:nucleoside-triphosphatase [Bacillota bacterium]
MIKNLFITGQKRMGKSTLLRNQIKAVQHMTGGFFVQRLFIDGRCAAFRMADITVEEYLPDLQVDTLDEYSDFISILEPNKTICLKTFENQGSAILQKARMERRIVLMDELGRLEMKAPGFMEEVRRTLDSDVPVLGVMKKESNPFLDSVRARDDVRVLDLDDSSVPAVQRQVELFTEALNIRGEELLI